MCGEAGGPERGKVWEWSEVADMSGEGGHIARSGKGFVRGERDPCRGGASYFGSLGMSLTVLALCMHRWRGDEGSEVGVVGGQSVV